MGELVIFDPAKGRHEADGAVQRIPGYGKRVEPIIRDRLVDGSWPKFLHPYPLSDKYFLVSCQPTPNVAVGHLPGRHVRQPDVPLLRSAGLRHARADAVPQDARGRRSFPTRRPESREATVYLSDIYPGEG